MTFGKLNSFVGGVAVGVFLLLSGGAISLDVLYFLTPSGAGPSIMVVGVFIIALSIVGLIGSVEK
jgi:hypothetical protein